MTAPVAEDAITALLYSLSTERREKVRDIARALIALGLDPETVNAVLAAVIVAAAEAQFDEEDAAPRESSSRVESLKELFSKVAPAPRPSRRDVN